MSIPNSVRCIARWHWAALAILILPGCGIAPAEASSAGDAPARDTTRARAVTPVHTAEAEQKLFHMVPGYHLELVAADRSCRTR
jgi:hypothetical protein